MKFKELSSNRLILRRFKNSDLEAFVAYRSDPDVARYQDWENYSEAQGKEFIQEQSQQDVDIPGTWLQTALELKETGTLIGDCAIHTLESDPRQIELGFTLSHQHQGYGYAQEALQCLLNFIFGALNKHRAIAITDTKNIPASRLLEKIGFRREGHFIKNIWFKGAWGDEFLYAMLQEEWLKENA